ncbi:tRNA lysidine(34) synthetase TilS [Ulvibacter litoralis]|uniref:tRNA(Ile)-lysidine synthase n=1 Tax=Ulvibacter litoralis TaxID=227084 RepID=A0A1G7HCL4_9FLAO|nr:tRNA lysidine(34) synthetase TilS [Ulvibacter litoralis]GHC57276.1 tRNA(Ile)-lysidine synthase [Ulvibacter litoralis]SDE98106.1 tRNA(Ile)-lysidine synthase [Ulvibacter litoralis]
MLQKFTEHIDSKLSFLKDKKLLIACSGGVDSVVLTHLLHSLQLNIALAHCNFSLRGTDSDGDEAFVVDLAAKLDCKIHTQIFDTKKYAKEHKLSTQMAARDLRYQWFDELLKESKYDYLLTGHHADDDIETFFINLSRGSGLRGLTGIPEVNDTIVRPLLSFGRDAILKYAKKHTLYWREDSSNASTDYLRNKLRINVLPEYKEAAPGLIQSFQKTRQHLEGAQHLIEDYMSLVYNLAVTEVSEGYHIDIQKLTTLPNTPALLYELLFPFGFTDLQAVEDLLTAQSGKQVFSKTHRLLKDRKVLFLTEKVSKKDEKTAINKIFLSKNEKKITIPFLFEIKSIEKIGNSMPTTIYVDADKLEYPLLLRKWCEGDVFQPFGMEGKKKLSKFFKDEKLSLVAKEKVWVLCSANKIVWVIGYRQDDRFKVDTNTKEIFKIITSL